MKEVVKDQRKTPLGFDVEMDTLTAAIITAARHIVVNNLSNTNI